MMSQARQSPQNSSPKHCETIASRLYASIFRILVKWFAVPDQPPTLPVAPGETLRAFKPDPGFLKYQKFIFWLLLTTIDGVITIAWLVLLFSFPLIGVLTFIPYLIIAFVPDIFAYVAIQLRYDTTWYVISPRSLRIRRGIWVIHETTITFENIQNVEVRQGPLERHFGISNLIVHTAGGGGGGEGKSAASGGAHIGILQGIGDAQSLRDLIMERAALARSAGLGDDSRAPSPHPSWSPAHLDVLREIREQLRGVQVRTAEIDPASR